MNDPTSDLVDELERLGLVSFLASFPPHSLRRDRWLREAPKVDEPLRPLVDLFLLGRPVPIAHLPSATAAALPALVGHGIVVPDGAVVSCGDLALFRPLGVWVFAEAPEALTSRHYLGPDSVALAMHSTPHSGEDVLDLCAGTGLQALAAARVGARVTAVELDPAVAGVARLNAALNGVRDRVEVLVGDLYEPVARGLRFDRVVANIPFVPSPPDLPFPVSGAGGPDGFALGRRVLQGLPARLRRRGTAHLVALFQRAGKRLVIEDELREWARSAECTVTVTLVADMPVGRDSGIVRGTAAAIAANGAGSAEGVVDRVAALYDADGVTAVAWSLLRIDRIDASGSGLRTIDISREGRSMPWASTL